MAGWRARMMVPLVAAMSLVVVACAKPPAAEKKAADGAAQAAKTAGAETHARSEFVAMTAALRKAEAEMTARAYQEARASYLIGAPSRRQGGRAAEPRRRHGQVGGGRPARRGGAAVEGLHARGESGAATLKAEQRALWNANARTIVERLASARAAIAGDTSTAREKLASVTAAIDKAEAELAAGSASSGKPSAARK